MTTAHRPTFNSAIGGDEQGGTRWHVPSRLVSVHTIPGFTKLKFRSSSSQVDDNVSISPEELKKALSQKELESAEQRRKEKARATRLDNDERPISSSSENEDTPGIASIRATASETAAVGAQVREALQSDDPDVDIESESDSSDSDSGGSDDEDELMRQLEQIRAERLEEQRRKERESRERDDMENAESILAGNPLLVKDTFAVKRSWCEDVVFRNQSRGEPEKKKRFINDTIRNDFHRRFLHKYIK